MADTDRTLQSSLHLNIVKFFHENQASIDTPRGVSTWVREERAKVKKALEELVGMKILVAHRSTSTTGYSYTRNAKIISKIEKLLKKRRAA
ncbi:MAG: hypothetical protein NT036_03545 [Candidatus Omnitrophica bacterium]|nr:hypothetical protein [Candidatus Omnitrophota bacterium]